MIASCIEVCSQRRIMSARARASRLTGAPPRDPDWSSVRRPQSSASVTAVSSTRVADCGLETDFGIGAAAGVLGTVGVGAVSVGSPALVHPAARAREDELSHEHFNVTRSLTV